jgi:hypothetical protein
MEPIAICELLLMFDAVSGANPAGLSPDFFAGGHRLTAEMMQVSRGPFSALQARDGSEPVTPTCSAWARSQKLYGVRVTTPMAADPIIRRASLEAGPVAACD